jgi:hypothetical protein
MANQEFLKFAKFFALIVFAFFFILGLSLSLKIVVPHDVLTINDLLTIGILCFAGESLLMHYIFDLYLKGEKDAQETKV